MYTNVLAEVRAVFEKKSDPKIKLQYEKYLKNMISFYGLRSPEVQMLFREFWERLKEGGLLDQKKLAVELLQSSYAEEKQFAILLLQKIVRKLPVSFLEKELSQLIDRFVYDWSTCDGLCSRVIRQFLEHETGAVNILVSWKNAPTIWRQRAAAVSFVLLARHGKYNVEIIDICSTLVRSKERFVQLGMGWVLRELSLADLELVINFIQENYTHFSREGLRYAIEKMEKGLQKEMLKL